MTSPLDTNIDDVLCRLTTGYTRKELLTFSSEDTGLDEYEVEVELSAVNAASRSIKALIKEAAPENKPYYKGISDEQFAGASAWNTAVRRYSENVDQLFNGKE